MNTQNGSAVVMVLLILGVLSLLGAGLMVQTRYDVRFNRAQGSYDKMINLADGAAKVSLYGVSYEAPPAYSGEGAQVPINPTEAGTWNTTQESIGKWQSQAWFLGATLNPQDMAGWEIGTGYYGQFWVAQGAGNRSDLGKENALSTVQVAGIKFTHN
jgi:hypothetical protein